ncbi:peptidase M23 [Micromonospora sp. WMMD882]|uniref:peptidase M23 n=1 Tax=Micromonospora sp. WMMD882 TaxID=3015151 RepID=UPI00248CC8AA|nr:peptidase M23 [Micromonospora sp. WMMD882]WBB80573.1 peptidase M23 [Micromonospora sp. WMMD882]
MFLRLARRGARAALAAGTASAVAAVTLASTAAAPATAADHPTAAVHATTAVRATTAPPTSAVVPAEAAPEDDVVPAVTGRLLDRVATHDELRAADAGDVRVSVTRRSGQAWAFGTAVVVAPHETDTHPVGWVFVARREHAGWRVAFDGEAAFADLARRAPDAVVTPAERAVFTAQVTPYAGGDTRTGMRLPYAVGQSWSYAGGPHGWAGSDSPWSSLDLAGGDQRVLAARAGTAYTMCRGWIRVIHDRGYATDYYHLWNNISVNGASVGEGTYLGDTGTDVTCGGSALGRHVHFALRQHDAYAPIAGHNIGKWVLVNGGSPYQGSALHGSAQVYTGGTLYNYGALGLTQGIVDSFGGGTVNRRSGPGTGYGVVGAATDGATVSVACSANGTTHTGRWGATALWNRLTDGSWISDAYLWTGVSGPVNGWC